MEAVKMITTNDSRVSLKNLAIIARCSNIEEVDHQ
jgi:hypothetical protein